MGSRPRVRVSRQTSSNGIGFFGALTILFIGLKLGKIITWSWWWVLSPLWLPLTAIIVIVLLVCLIIYGGACLIDLKNSVKYKLRKKKKV